MPCWARGTRNVAEDSVARGHGFLSQWARAEARFPPFDPSQLQPAGHAQTLPARPRHKGAGLDSAPRALELLWRGFWLYPGVLSPAVSDPLLPSVHPGAGQSCSWISGSETSSPVPCAAPVSWVAVCLFALFPLNYQSWNLGSTSLKERHPLSPGRQGQRLRALVDGVSFGVHKDLQSS